MKLLSQKRGIDLLRISESLLGIRKGISERSQDIHQFRALGEGFPGKGAVCSGFQLKVGEIVLYGLTHALFPQCDF